MIVSILMGQLKMIINKSTKGVVSRDLCAERHEIGMNSIFGKWRGEFLEKNLPLNIAEHLSGNLS
jgi:hypothetical protein